MARAGPVGHDRLSRRAAAALLARVFEVEFLGDLSREALATSRALVVPSDTLPTRAQALAVGIRRAEQLFGGAVPIPFVATKIITHPLVDEQAFAPPRWSSRFGHRVRAVVLPGFSAFTAADVITAGERLLAEGPIRLKEARGIGGAGQQVVTDGAALRAAAAALDPDRLRAEGLVIERNLQRVTTWSVGQVRVGALTASYVGTQRLVRNHRGHETYGGSDLALVRGGFDALLAATPASEQRRVVGQAMVYHRHALDSFRGLFATRANYDVACGHDERGASACGVLEQSWRIGGATGAELLGLGALRADPAMQSVAASTHEVYGEAAAPGPGAVVLFDGSDDAGLGRLFKYAELGG